MKIGIEIHLQINLQKKLFSNSSSIFSSKPNSNISFLDIGSPGVFPILNLEALKEASYICKNVLHQNISKSILFDRKHYIYNDLPFGYQITQKREPIGQNGFIWAYDKELNEEFTKISLLEAHLEQDTARNFKIENKNYIDYNRSGNCLLEIVSKPEFHSINQLKSCLRMLLISLKENNLMGMPVELGGFRVDINISTENCPKRVEIKNINSIRNIGRAIQIFLLSDESFGGKTLSYNEKDNSLTIMRDKENYLYTPEFNFNFIDINNPYYNVSSDSFIDIPFFIKEILEKYKDISFEDAIEWSANKQRRDLFELLSYKYHVVVLLTEFLPLLDSMKMNFIDRLFKIINNINNIPKKNIRKILSNINESSDSNFNKIFEDSFYTKIEEDTIFQFLDNISDRIKNIKPIHKKKVINSLIIEHKGNNVDMREVNNIINKWLKRKEL